MERIRGGLLCVLLLFYFAKGVLGIRLLFAAGLQIMGDGAKRTAVHNSLLFFAKFN